jgi:hypothetical protein
MTRRFGLTSKIVLLAILNFVLLGLVFAAFLKLELRQDMGSFLMATGRERILAVSRQLALDLEETAPAGRDALLARYGATNGVRFYLFLNDGPQVAGEMVDLPQKWNVICASPAALALALAGACRRRRNRAWVHPRDCRRKVSSLFPPMLRSITGWACGFHCGKKTRRRSSAPRC